MEMLLVILGGICVLASIFRNGWIKTIISLVIGAPVGAIVLGGLGYILTFVMQELSICTGYGCMGLLFILAIWGAVVGAFIGFFLMLWFLVRRDKRKRK